jgi:hypothetical protein
MELTEKTQTQLLTCPALSQACRVLGQEHSSLKGRQSAGVTGSWAQTSSFDATTCFGHAEPSTGRKINTSEKLLELRKCYIANSTDFSHTT